MQSSGAQKRDALSARIEDALTKRFGAELKVVVLIEAQFRSVVESAPAGEGGFGSGTHRSDVIFLRPPLTAAQAFGPFELKEGIDRIWKGKGVVYFSRLDARATSSRMGRIVATPEYKDMTIRSWTTTTKLLGLMQERTQACARLVPVHQERSRVPARRRRSNRPRSQDRGEVLLPGSMEVGEQP